jgi:Fur family transcriptional regulator, zinc uptake regulator
MMPSAAPRDPFADTVHDHQRCIRVALDQALAVCASRGLRLTDLRRQVLEIVWQSHAPIGAYQILERLAGRRGRVAPPTVYRALEFLTREGLVHRIDSRNAYVGCTTPAQPHQAYFFICRDCGEAAEFHDPALAGSIGRCVQRAGFRLTSATVELAGLCSRCGTAAPEGRG